MLTNAIRRQGAVALLATLLLALTLLTAPATDASTPVKPANGQFLAGKGANTLRFDVVRGKRVKHFSVYSACSRGTKPPFYADTYGFPIRKGKVKIDSTFTNVITNQKVTFRAEIRFTAKKKAKGWFSLSEGACTDTRHVFKRIRFSAR